MSATLMRTRAQGRCCLKATALGASGAHDAYRIRAHTFLKKSQRISHIVDGAAGEKSDIIKRQNEQGEAPDASEKEEK